MPPHPQDRTFVGARPSSSKVRRTMAREVARRMVQEEEAATRGTAEGDPCRAAEKIGAEAKTS